MTKRVFHLAIVLRWTIFMFVLYQVWIHAHWSVALSICGIAVACDVNLVVTIMNLFSKKKNEIEVKEQGLVALGKYERKA